MANDRILSTDNEKTDGISDLLEKASDVARRVLGSIQTIAGTTNCKGVQIHELKKYATNNGYWIADIDKLGIYSDRGSENEVYISLDGRNVLKLNDFRYSDNNLNAFFCRIKIHNALFPGCAYTLIGFAENKNKKICAVLSQPFIHADREASTEEIAGALALMGFMPCGNGEYFTNGDIDIFDALPNNVLHGIDGQFYFIDTILFKSDISNLTLYKSLSPRFYNP